MPIFRRLEGEERKKAIDDPGKSWKRWAREDLARYWYNLLCLFLDVMLVLQFVEPYSKYGGEENLIFMILSVIALIPVTYVEFNIYKRLFPERF
ncbi:MAG: hypothetical protein M1290_02310 [Candidatus Thermoplasmatota archaeon]|jgi:hypothetical protein|nr:hypothetical protein [Candidatus Thermoplasmatota archaeon]MCL5789280.1 hypothetical protein [Candidatus Thermoplasmatota archaeon]